METSRLHHGHFAEEPQKIQNPLRRRFRPELVTPLKPADILGLRRGTPLKVLIEREIAKVRHHVIIANECYAEVTPTCPVKSYTMRLWLPLEGATTFHIFHGPIACGTPYTL